MAKPYLVLKGSTWQIVESLPGGKKKWTSTRQQDKDKAEAMLAEIVASRGLLKSKGQVIREVILDRTLNFADTIASVKHSFEDAWQVYLADGVTQDMMERSRNSVRLHYTAFATWCISRNVQHVEDVSYDVAMAYMKHRKEQGAGDGTLINVRNCLSGAFKRIKRPLKLLENPFEDVRNPRRPNRKTHRCFTQEELTQLMDSLPWDWQLLIKIAYYTGLRFGDCCCFRIECVRDGVAYPEPRKLTRYAQKLAIPLPEDLLADIRKASGERKTGYLLPERAEKYLNQDNEQAYYFGQKLEELGIPKLNEYGLLDFHSIRHTFNTRLIEAGVDEGVRMKLTGHTNLKTNQIYNHATEAARRAVAKLPKLE